MGMSFLGYTAKPLAIDRTSRFHPSIRTNSKSLNGSEMMTGGNIIMPIARSTFAMTMSMTKKGK